MEFAGTPRFAVQRTLGAGGFGIVYQAYDRERQRLVALKTLRRMDAAGLFRFKQEFRGLSDISHPNLVTLYELLAEGDEWFFTMELVEGTNLIQYVRGVARPHVEATSENHPALASDADASTVALPGPRAVTSPGPGPTAELHTGPDLVRLRAAFAQLADGVAALHAGGLLHRDLKPSNVLVTREGRVVILDFGLALELVSTGDTRSIVAAGTPAYMSPEQCTGRPVSAAGDWYSVGVMLFEALTGTRPFPAESFIEMAALKHEAPPSPRRFVPDLPEDLDALCLALLSPTPADRPTGQELVNRLGGVPRTDLPAPAVRDTRDGTVLVGRARHLAALDSAFQAMRAGGTVTVCVTGKSGLGKTALVRRFLRDLRLREKDVVVLVGRCYERESVPYKALDTIVDAIAHYLGALETADVERVLPRDIHAVTRLFPVLRRVPAVSGARRRANDIPDSQELRRRAFAALRELMGRLSDAKPLVLFIDDMQWGDLDSCALLADLLAPPDPPALMLVIAYRGDEVNTNPILESLLPALRRASSIESFRQVEVEELTPDDVREMASTLIGPGQRSAADRVEAIVKESGGSPFFVDALVNYAAVDLSDAADVGLSTPTLEHVIQARLKMLSDEGRRLLEIVSVATGPVSVTTAAEAARLSVDPGLVDVLRTRHWVRTRGEIGRQRMEPYHERIREAVLSGLSAETRKADHHRLAIAFEAEPGADPERLATHFSEAGEISKAAEYLAVAAEQAADTLAFDRAARLYARALDLGTSSEARAHALRLGRANALANAGRGAEAAAVFLEAAATCTKDDAYDLRRRAAEQLLISGNIDDGLGVLETVLSSVGLELAKTPERALLSLMTRRALLRLRGLGFRERRAADLPASELRLIDACWSVSIGLSMSDNLRAADFQARQLLLALRAGEPYRLLRALAMEVGQRAVPGVRARKDTEAIIARATDLARRTNHPHGTALLTLNRGVAAYLWGEFRSGVELMEQAEKTLREECTGVFWERDTTHVFWIFCHYWTGEWAVLTRRVLSLIAEVEERGDKYAAAYMRLRSLHLVHLAADDVERAREQERLGIHGWSRQGFQIPHFSHWLTRQEIDLYDNQAASAWERMRVTWPVFTASRLPRIEAVLIQALDMRARCALALAASPSTPVPVQTLLASAERDAARIEKRNVAWANGLARVVRASVAAIRRDRDKALAQAADAERLLDHAGLAMYAAATRRRRGEMIGGEQGQAVVRTGDAWMQQQAIKNPARVTAMLVPGDWAAR